MALQTVWFYLRRPNPNIYLNTQIIFDTGTVPHKPKRSFILVDDCYNKNCPFEQDCWKNYSAELSHSEELIKMLELFNASKPRSVKYFDSDRMPWRLMLSTCQNLFCQGNYLLVLQRCLSMIIVTYGLFCLAMAKWCCSRKCQTFWKKHLLRQCEGGKNYNFYLFNHISRTC